MADGSLNRGTTDSHVRDLKLLWIGESVRPRATPLVPTVSPPGRRRNPKRRSYPVHGNPVGRARMGRKAPTGGIHPEVTLAHPQEWKLYHNGFLMCSKKVRVCMTELGLPYRVRHIDLIETGASETVGRRYRQVNPAGNGPVLVHQGREAAAHRRSDHGN